MAVLARAAVLELDDGRGAHRDQGRPLAHHQERSSCHKKIDGDSLSEFTEGKGRTINLYGFVLKISIIIVIMSLSKLLWQCSVLC